jgi:hypothetical protein
MNWLYLLFVDIDIKQWAAVQNDTLLATLTWTPNGGRSDTLIGATPFPQANLENSTEALTQLLLHVRRVLPSHLKLSLEYPGGEMTGAFTSAGFTERRTLLWMRAEPAT